MVGSGLRRYVLRVERFQKGGELLDVGFVLMFGKEFDGRRFDRTEI
jgi:hypothetical protein